MYTSKNIFDKGAADTMFCLLLLMRFVPRQGSDEVQTFILVDTGLTVRIYGNFFGHFILVIKRGFTKGVGVDVLYL